MKENYMGGACSTELRSRNLKGEATKKDLSVGLRSVLKWILEKSSERCGLDSYGSGYGAGSGTSEHGNEPKGSIKDREYAEYLSDY
jgi:hypothetical protein